MGSWNSVNERRKRIPTIDHDAIIHYISRVVRDVFDNSLYPYIDLGRFEEITGLDSKDLNDYLASLVSHVESGVNSIGSKYTILTVPGGILLCMQDNIDFRRIDNPNQLFYWLDSHIRAFL
jgi:hypothetical protein